MGKNENVGDSYEKILCAECMCLREYDIKNERETRTVNGKDYTFSKKVGICRHCGNKIMVPGLDDENERAFEYIYRLENGYIQVDEIKEILDKYNIEKRPLSKVLGMGEHTIEKYLEGQLPNKKYSNCLQNVRNSYIEMLYYYNINKDKLTDKACEKIEEKLAYYKRINDCPSMIEKISNYVLNSKYEITNMSLQKLLYYIEGFGQVLLGERLFENVCEAWMYGPVYPDIYEKYKVFGREQIIIEQTDMSDILEEKYRNLVDYVLKHFGIYNGVTLKDLSHAEEPWKKAHEGYADDERCNEIITHDSIGSYFERINNTFKLNTDAGVKRYIDSLDVM